MINITLTKKQIRFIRNYTRANASSFLDLQNTLQAVLPKGTGVVGDDNDPITVSIDISYIYSLFEGIGSMPEKYYAEINEELQEAVYPQMTELFYPVLEKVEVNSHLQGLNKKMMDAYNTAVNAALPEDLAAIAVPLLHEITPLTDAEKKVLTLYTQMTERRKDIEAFVNSKCEW